MNKHELVGLTLDQLIEAFKDSPESFEYEDNMYPLNKLTANPTIFWQPKIELKDAINSTSVNLNDPNNANRAVVVTLNEVLNEITCYIFCRAVHNISLMGGQSADAVMSSKQLFLPLRSNYRKFRKLRKLILRKDKARETTKFLRKLTSIFPSTLDKHLLG